MPARSIAKSLALKRSICASPSPLRGLPRSKDEALAVALRHNPTLLAAESDKDAAEKRCVSLTARSFRTVSLEGSASRAFDTNGSLFRRDDVSGKVVISWDVFRGGQDSLATRRNGGAIQRKKPCGTPACNETRWKRSTGPGQREPSGSHRRAEASARGAEGNDRHLPQGI